MRLGFGCICAAAVRVAHEEVEIGLIVLHVEAVLGAGDERLVDLDPADHPDHEHPPDERGDDPVAHGVAVSPKTGTS